MPDVVITETTHVGALGRLDTEECELFPDGMPGVAIYETQGFS